MSKKVEIHRLETGVPGLDNLLGGGFPEFSFNLIAGMPGCGKTTLAHQIMFTSANLTYRALYFTVLGEPPLKMLRYQQQFAHFDVAKVNQSIRFVNLSADLLNGDLEHVMERISDEVKNFGPSMVFVDSFRSIVKAGQHADQLVASQQQFLQRLGMLMSSWQATTFLIGEYPMAEAEASPVFAVADGILWLSQNLQRNSMVRKMQVTKMRGQAHSPGLHTFRITERGVQVFPRAIVKHELASVNADGHTVVRLSMGVIGLDNMLGGGLPRGYSLLVVGPSGSGKTILATEFLAEGVHRGEKGVIAAFEKSPSQLIGNVKLYSLVHSGHVGVIDTRSLDLSIDETLHNLIEMINRMQAKRVVIDSLTGFEMALAPEFSEDFRSALYRMIAELTGMGVTVLMTSELEDRFTDLRFSPFGSSHLADAIVMQRYVEIEGQLRRTMSVIKVRGSEHSKDIRFFDITENGVVVGNPLTEFSGILTGRPTMETAQNNETKGTINAKD